MVQWTSFMRRPVLRAGLVFVAIATAAFLFLGLRIWCAMLYHRVGRGCSLRPAG